MLWMTAVLVCVGGLLQGHRVYVAASLTLWTVAAVLFIATGTWFGLAWT
jgi:hypothetical protein